MEVGEVVEEPTLVDEYTVEDTSPPVHAFAADGTPLTGAALAVLGAADTAEMRIVSLPASVSAEAGETTLSPLAPESPTGEAPAASAKPSDGSASDAKTSEPAQRRPTLFPRAGAPTIPRPITGKISTGPVSTAPPKTPAPATPGKISSASPPATKTAVSAPPPAKPSGTPVSKPSGTPVSKPSGTPASKPSGTPVSMPSGSPASKPSGSSIAPLAVKAASSPAPASKEKAASITPITAPVPTPRPATVPPAPPMMRTASPPYADPFAEDPTDDDPFAEDAFAEPAPVPVRVSVPVPELGAGDTVPAPPFDPARATLPMMLEIEPPTRSVDMASMRATIPMALELPKDLEAMFAETGDTAVRVEGVRLDAVEAFEGMPRPVHEMLADKAEVVQLGPDEEVSGFGAALLLSGMATLCATIVDAAAHWARPGELLVSKGSLSEGIAVRVVGAGDGASVAVWPRAVVERAFAEHAGAAARAKAFGDRLQALAGATMGPFGEIDDEDRRALAMDLSVRCLRPGEIWLEDGAPAPPVALVGAGAMELYGPISEETSETIEPGALVFPELGAGGGEAPASARAGAQGALLLVAERDAAQRMAGRVPDLAARLRGA